MCVSLLPVIFQSNCLACAQMGIRRNAACGHSLDHGYFLLRFATIFPFCFLHFFPPSFSFLRLGVARAKYRTTSYPGTHNFHIIQYGCTRRKGPLLFTPETFTGFVSIISTVTWGLLEIHNNTVTWSHSKRPLIAGVPVSVLTGCFIIFRLVSLYACL